MMNRQMELIDFNAVNSVIDKTYGFEGSMPDFKDLVMKAINGELDFSLNGIFGFIYKNFFDEILLNAALIKNLIVIGLLSAVLKVLTSSFKEKSVGELGFLSCYIVLITVLFTSFSAQAGIIEDLIRTLLTMLEAAAPLMFSLIVLSGNASGAYALNAIAITGANIIGQFIYKFLLPVIIFAAVIQMINYLSNRDVLTKLSELGKSAGGFILKGAAALYVGALSLAGVVSPITGGLIQKTAKVTVKTIPVVGETLSGSVELAAAYASALKSGTMAALVIMIIIVCSMPVIKLLAIIFIYKLTAALIQPVCDERIVKCIDTIGSFMLILLAAGFTVVIMFIFSVVIMLGM